MFRNVRPWLRFIEGTGGAGGAGSAGSPGAEPDAHGDGASDQGDKGDGDGDKGDGDSSGGDDDPEPEPEPKKEEDAPEPPVDTEQADGKKESEEKISAEAFKELQATVANLQAENAKQAEEKLAAEAKDVAKAHGIPEGMADRLNGKNRAELEADAKKLAQVLGTRATDPTQGQGGAGTGRRGLGEVIAARIAAAGLK